MALHRTTRPLLRSVIYSQSGADTRCWQLLCRTATLTHTPYGSICYCCLWTAVFIIRRLWIFYEIDLTPAWFFSSNRTWRIRRYEALHPPPASLVPRHLCQSHFGPLMRHQPSAPPLHWLQRLSLLEKRGESVKRLKETNTCSNICAATKLTGFVPFVKNMLPWLKPKVGARCPWDNLHCCRAVKRERALTETVCKQVGPACCCYAVEKEQEPTAPPFRSPFSSIHMLLRVNKLPSG